MTGYQTLEVKGAYTKVPWDGLLTHKHNTLNDNGITLKDYGIA